MTDRIADTISTNLGDSRQASEALSISSGATAVNSDSAIDAKADDFEDLFKLDLRAANTDACQSNETKTLNDTFDKFCQLPSQLLRGLFEQAEVLCPAGECFKPFYKQGMLKGYIINKQPTSEDVNADSEISKAYIMSDNVDILARTLVTKQYAQAYIEAFYSQNEFSFKDPRAAMWFFKKLGNKFRYLRKLELIMTGGLVHQTYVSAVDFCTETFEELWWRLLCWIEHRHQLEHLSLIFKWTRSEYALRNFDRADDDKIDEMMLFRQKLVCRLGRRWGIKSVNIEDKSNGFFANEEEIFEVQLAMQQTKTDAGVEDKRKAPLLEVLQAAEDRSHTANGIIDFGECEDSELGYEEEAEDGIRASQPLRTAAGGRVKGGHGSGTTSSATEAHEKEAKQKHRTDTQKTGARQTQESINAQLLAQLPVHQSQVQPSRISSIVNSIGINTSPSSSNRQQATSSTIPASQFYGSTSQQRGSSRRGNHDWNEYDRGSDPRRSSSNTTHGNGRKQNNKFYGRRQHTEQKLWDYDA